MKYHLLSVALLVAALPLYTVGYAGSALALAAAVVLEAWFWMRVMNRKSKTSATVTHP
jgi:membrane protein implicated in regulation of membrane protease activity